MENELIEKPAQKELEALFKQLEKLEKSSALNGANADFIENVKKSIRRKIDRIQKVMQSEITRQFTSEFRRNYYSIIRDLPAKNVGITKYEFDKLSPFFKNAYKTSARNALDLITTQNDEVMAKLEARFYNWITLQSVGNDKQKLRELVELPKNKRINFILRDQSHKLASAIDYAIAQKYRAIAFEWRTRQDKRVVGKPGGLYPKADDDSKMHGNHYKRNGKFYYYSQNLDKKTRDALYLSKFAGDAKDLADGLPGMPIGCRCYAVNYYDIRDLPKNLVKGEKNE